MVSLEIAFLLLQFFWGGKKAFLLRFGWRQACDSQSQRIAIAIFDALNPHPGMSRIETFCAGHLCIRQGYHAVGNYYLKYSWEYSMQIKLHYIFLYSGRPGYFRHFLFAEKHGPGQNLPNRFRYLGSRNALGKKMHYSPLPNISTSSSPENAIRGSQKPSCCLTFASLCL